MATEFVMPKLGLTMEEGTITEWLAESGDAVRAGTAVLVIATDKVETEVEAPADGVLHRTGSVGETFRCGTVIAYLLADDEAPPAAASVAAAPAAPSSERIAAPVGAPEPATGGSRLFATPNARRLAAERGVALRSLRGTGPGGRIVGADVLEAAAAAPPARSEPARSRDWSEPPASSSASAPATAAARQLAELLGVDIRLVPPSSPDRRRSREDVAVYVRQHLAAVAERRSPAAALLQQPSTVIPLTGMRGAIAERMHASLADMAQLTLHRDAVMDAVVADRDRRKQIGPAPGYTDYVIAATARALREHPILNSQVVDDGIALLPEIHIGMAVAVEGGLVVPVIRHADRLDLTSLSAESTRLAEAARSKRLQLVDLEGGTFSVSTLGSYGVDGFTPVVNAPNAAILGVGRLRDQVEVVDGQVRSTKVLTLSLTWDHRVLDGAPAAAFCARVADLLGDPVGLDRTP